MDDINNHSDQNLIIRNRIKELFRKNHKKKCLNVLHKNL